jgi:AcrR family transcriptional regulator
MMISSGELTTRADGPSLAPKRAPSQARGVETYERILNVCAELLGEVGIERVSTNLICQRAGITPPGLYQYFPNKYAILHELGLRLLRHQRLLLLPWARPATLELPEDELTESVAQLFLRMLELTRLMPAGVWVTRAMRAVPSLQATRLHAHAQTTELLLQALLAAYPRTDAAQARLTLRLALDAMHAAYELSCDDASIDTDALARTVSAMVVGQVVKLRPDCQAERGAV